MRIKMNSRITLILCLGFIAPAFASELNLVDLVQEWDGPRESSTVKEQAGLAANGLAYDRDASSMFGDLLAVIEDPMSDNFNRLEAQLDGLLENPNGFSTVQQKRLIDLVLVFSAGPGLVGGAVEKYKSFLTASTSPDALAYAKSEWQEHFFYFDAPDRPDPREKFFEERDTPGRATLCKKILRWLK